MTKRIILEFERGGTVFAELLEKKAPKTCKAILRALPVENKVIHAMWAGEDEAQEEQHLRDPLRELMTIAFRTARRHIPSETNIFSKLGEGRQSLAGTQAGKLLAEVCRASVRLPRIGSLMW